MHATSRELLDGQEKIVQIEKSMDKKETEIDAYIDELKNQEKEMSDALERLSVFEADLSMMDVDKGVVTVELPGAQISYEFVRRLS